jgi:hypothetical protein
MVVLQQLYTYKRYLFCGTTFGAYQNTKYIHMHENISTCKLLTWQWNICKSNMGDFQLSHRNTYGHRVWCKFVHTPGDRHL